MKQKLRSLKLPVIFAAIGLLLYIFLKPAPKNLKDQTFKTLIPNISVNQSALFHPLMRQGSLKPLSDPELDSLAAYLVVDSETGEVYTAKDASKRVSAASFTKLMTAMVALDVIDPETKLIASARAASQEPTVLGVKAGEVFTLEELIYAMIQTSANDAATIVGEEALRKYRGNEEVFIALMNKKAEELGLGDTHFANTQGFDHPMQYSNAYDLARIARYAYHNYPLIRKAAAVSYASLEANEDHGFYHLPNWNALLGTYPGVDGIKIGYTQEAGFCTLVSATRAERSVIVVVLDADSIVERDLAAAKLLNYAFDSDSLEKIVVSQELIKPRLDEWRKLRQQILEENKGNKD